MANKNTYTLEELRAMNLISNTDKRPTPFLTDEKWQKEFELRKAFVKPVQDTKINAKFSRACGSWNEETQGMYYGDTNWQQYCAFINDILKNIRSGSVDYCYFLYQIMDLLKFHPNELCTRYVDGYWEVWLERSKFVQAPPKEVNKKKMTVKKTSSKKTNSKKTVSEK